MLHILNLIWSYLLLHKSAELELLGGSAGVSTLVQAFLHSSKIQGYIKSFLISHIGALIGALATYAVSGTNYNVGTTYLLVWFASQFWHGFAVNPIYKKYFLPFLTWLATQRGTTEPVPSTATPADTELV